MLRAFQSIKGLQLVDLQGINFTDSMHSDSTNSVVLEKFVRKKKKKQITPPYVICILAKPSTNLICDILYSGGTQ